jgi:cytochrome c oxidase assembly factor CtaG
VRRRGSYMLWAIFIVLLLLWLAGVVANYTLGGLIHLVLGLAVLVLLAQVITREGSRSSAREAAEDQDSDESEDKRVA